VSLNKSRRNYKKENIVSVLSILEMSAMVLWALAEEFNIRESKWV
jgi:hypothetical protein